MRRLIARRGALPLAGRRAASLHARPHREGFIMLARPHRAFLFAVADAPVAEAVENGPIVAHSMNGQPMSAREKGPPWIIYPYDGDGRRRSERGYSPSIWRLTSIDVR